MEKNYKNIKLYERARIFEKNTKMKKIIVVLALLASFYTQAQLKMIDNAVIISKTTITSPENTENIMPDLPPAADGERRIVMRYGGDSETKSTTTLKGDLMKTLTESESSRTIVIRDNAKKTTTTIMEMMGKQSGFYSTDEDMAEQQKKMDSMMQTRVAQIKTAPVKMVSNTISYNEETKIIAGLLCKKAFVILEFENGKKDTTHTIWYTPEFKLKGISSTQATPSSIFGLGIQNSSTIGKQYNPFNELQGFPLKIEMGKVGKRRTVVEVTKINTEKIVSDKEFAIPKDVEIKSIKDIQTNNDQKIQIRIGG